MLGIITATSVITLIVVIVIVAQGLSYISQSLGGSWYGKKAARGYYYGDPSSSYWKNPLLNYKSKWFSYRPADSVVLSKKEWTAIENNVASKITEECKAAEERGYNRAKADFRRAIEKERSSARAWAQPENLFGVNPTEQQVKEVHEGLKKLYDPEKFKFDPDFHKLAKVRIKMFDEMVSKIRTDSSRKGCLPGKRIL